jgi:hypothetical protein
MSQSLLQALIEVGFGALCFGGDYLTAFHRHAQPVARRNDQARFGSLQLTDRQMGMGRAAERTDEVGSGMRREGSL